MNDWHMPAQLIDLSYRKDHLQPPKGEKQTGKVTLTISQAKLDNYYSNCALSSTDLLCNQRLTIMFKDGNKGEWTSVFAVSVHSKNGELGFLLRQSRHVSW